VGDGPAVVARARGDERVDVRALAQRALDAHDAPSTLNAGRPEPVGLVLEATAPTPSAAASRQRRAPASARTRERGVEGRASVARRRDGAGRRAG
jgi:hypothetical protein